MPHRVVRRMHRRKEAMADPTTTPQLTRPEPKRQAKRQSEPVPNLSPQAVYAAHKGRKLRIGWDYVLRCYVAFDFSTQRKLFTCESLALLNVDLIVNEKQRTKFVTTDEKPIHTWMIGRVCNAHELNQYDNVKVHYDPYTLSRFCCYTGWNYSKSLDAVYGLVLESVDLDGWANMEGVVPLYRALTGPGREAHMAYVIKEINSLMGK